MNTPVLFPALDLTIATRSWTDLVVTPERRLQIVDGLLSRLHEPKASHVSILEALVGREGVTQAYPGYLWHEFGDLHLILPERR